MSMKNVEIGKTCMEYTIGKETLRLENMVGSVVTTDQVINTKAENIENRIYPGNTLTCSVTNKNAVKYHARQIESLMRYEKNKKVGTPKEVNLLKVLARTLIIDTPEDIALFLSKFGREFENFIVPDWKKLSRCRKFSAVFFSKNAVLGAPENSPLYGLENKLVVVNDKMCKIHKVTKSDLERATRRWCHREKPKRVLCETTIARIGRFTLEGGKAVLHPVYDEDGYNKNLGYISESNLSRAFGKKMANGSIDFKNFAIFKGAITQQDVDVEVDELLEREGRKKEDLSKEELKLIENETIKSFVLLRTEMIMNGYYDAFLGEHFTYCATSGSQGRTGSCLFSTIPWEETNKHCFGKYGVKTILDENCEVEVSVLDKRKSLKMSSSTKTELRPRVARKNDVDALANVDYEAAVEFFKENGAFLIEKSLAVKEYTKAHKDAYHKDGRINMNILPPQLKSLLNGTVTDGQCSGTLDLFTKISVQYGRITEEEAFLLNKKYEKFDNLTDFFRSLTGRLRKAYLNMIKFVTFRYGGAKGSIVLHDFNKKKEEYKNVDILMPDSVCKFEVPMDDEGRFIGEEFSVCLENKPLKGRANLNYQAIVAMEGLTGDILIELAKKIIDDIENALSDPIKAQILLTRSMDAQEAEKEACEEEQKEKLSEEDKEKAKKNAGYTSFLAKALAASGKTLYDGYVNKKAKEMYSKTIWDMAFGKIEIDGDYAFIVTDPNVLIGDFKNCLQEEECYLSGKEGYALLARAPLAYKSEIRKVKLVKCEHLEYLNDVLVLNPFTGLLHAMSGADTDGDKVLVIYQEELVDNVKPTKSILVDCIKHKARKKVKPTEYNVRKARSNSMDTAQVGIFANIAVVARDAELSGYKYLVTPSGRKISFDSICKDVRFLEALAVDFQGKLKVPEHVKVPGKPMWLYMKKELDKDSKTFISKKGNVKVEGEVVESCSPMTQLYNFIHNYMQTFDDVCVDVAVNYSNYFSKAINLKNKHRLISRVERDNREYNNLVRLNMNIDTKGKTKEQIEDEKEENWGTVRRFVDNCAMAYRSAADTQIDMDTIVAAVYDVCYSDSERGYGSFVWNVLGDELLDLMSRTLGGNNIVRMNVKEDVNEVNVNALGMAFDGENCIGTFNLPEGNHKLIEYKGKKYVEVPKEIVTKDFVNEDNTRNQISLHCGGRKTKEVIDILKEGKLRITVKRQDNKKLYAFVDGEPLVQVCGFGLKEIFNAENKVFDLEYNDFGVMYRAYTKYNRTDIEWTDENQVFAYKKNITFFCREVGVVTDENGEEEQNLIINEVEDQDYGAHNIDNLDEVQIIEDQEDLKDLFDESISDIDDEDDDLGFNFSDYAEEYGIEGDFGEDFNTDDFQ